MSYQKFTKKKCTSSFPVKKYGADLCKIYEKIPSHLDNKRNPTKLFSPCVEGSNSVILAPKMKFDSALIL